MIGFVCALILAIIVSMITAIVFIKRKAAQRIE